MFSGTSALNLDAKGRIAIPTRYREHLRAEHAGKLIVTVDISSPCLLIYPDEEWQKISAKLLTLSDFQPQERAMKRLMLGYAQEYNLDTNGRILLTTPLRDYAKLDKKAMLIGQLNKFELWNDIAWQQELENSLSMLKETNFADSEQLANFSL